MRSKQKAMELTIIAVTLIIGCILCGLGTDFGLNTILYPGIGFCVFSGVFLFICIFKWIDEA